MSIGDTVIVKFRDTPGEWVGRILQHTPDWANVTIQCANGSTVTGIVDAIEKASLFT
jgi:hypothetical protein